MRAADIKADGETPYKALAGKIVVLEAPVKTHPGASRMDSARVKFVGDFSTGKVKTINLRDISREWTASDEAKLEREIVRKARMRRINDRLSEAGFNDTIAYVRGGVEDGDSVRISLQVRAGNDATEILKLMNINTD